MVDVYVGFHVPSFNDNVPKDELCKFRSQLKMISDTEDQDLNQGVCFLQKPTGLRKESCDANLQRRSAMLGLRMTYCLHFLFGGYAMSIPHQTFDDRSEAMHRLQTRRV